MRSLKDLQVPHAHISYDFYQHMVGRWEQEQDCQNTPTAGLLELMVLPREVRNWSRQGTIPAISDNACRESGRYGNSSIAKDSSMG